MGTQRFALCDLALPGPDDSFVGHAVALVVAVSQNPDEFPLAAVRIKAAAEQSEELRCLYQRVRTLPKGYPEIALKFGAVLYEGLFACPLNGGKVEIDFARRRHEMFVLEVPDARAADAPPSVEILLELGAREFPKLVQSSPGWCRPAGGTDAVRDRRGPSCARQGTPKGALRGPSRGHSAAMWAWTFPLFFKLGRPLPLPPGAVLCFLFAALFPADQRAVGLAALGQAVFFNFVFDWPVDLAGFGAGSEFRGSRDFGGPPRSWPTFLSPWIYARPSVLAFRREQAQTPGCLSYVRRRWMS